MKFTKMHGLGNDYVFVSCFDQHVENPPMLARAMSDRHTGIGSDGLILIQPSKKADVRMVVFNSDGSRAQTCGNGLRCVAKYVVEHGLSQGPGISIETDAGVAFAKCDAVGGIVRSVRVDMGPPVLTASAIPTTIARERIIDHPLHITLPGPDALTRAERQAEYTVTCVSVGNPHAVVFVDDLDAIAPKVIGPRIECAPQFPERINVHFVRVDSPQRVTMKTWERGSGETKACGSGACAVCVAGAVTERTRRAITAILPGGELKIEWADDDHVYMTGPAVEVFSGEWPG